MANKLVAFVAYFFGWIGLLIAWLVNKDKKDEFVSFHIRQALLIWLLMLLTWIPVVGWILALLLLIGWIIGLYGAITGQQKLVPLIGKYAQEWFKSI